MAERLQKLLSAAGICSRRAGEAYILEGRVTVNGVVAGLGDRADPEIDEIALDGKTVLGRAERTILMLDKPRGVVTTLSDERGRKTVADLVGDCPARVWPVGRLDRDSEGLLLLTNDGSLTNALIHPRHEIEKEYLVSVKGATDEGVARLSEPMTLDGRRLQAARVYILKWEADGRARLSITIHEGKNRQIRRMCASVGMTVTRLKRIREGNLELDPRLAPGQWRYVTPEEEKTLRRETFLQE